MGNVSCQAACKFVPALPPAYLPCPSHQATLTHVPTNPCCTQWTCSHSSAQLPGKQQHIDENEIFIPQSLNQLIDIL